ncbi:MAG: hypothetical protein AAF721_33150 [Myxococcota bacterium]
MTHLESPSNERWERSVHRALVATSDDPTGAASSVTVDAIWDAVLGKLPSRQAQAVLDAALMCPAAYAELRLALALTAELDAIGIPETDDAPSRWTSRWLPLSLAVAAALLAAIALRPAPRSPLPAHGAGYRDGATAAIVSALDDGAALSRDAFVLSWGALPDARYDVSVSTESARILFVRRGIREAELTVPAPVLADLAAGTRVLWRVEAVQGDGTRTRSATFVVVVQ